MNNYPYSSRAEQDDIFVTMEGTEYKLSYRDADELRRRIEASLSYANEKKFFATRHSVASA